MPGNRVDKLEAKVSELESTIDGLTSELLEAQDRIRELEEELEDEGMDPGPFDEAAPEEVKEAAAQAEARTDPPEEEKLPDDGEAPETFEADKDAGDEEKDERTESGLGDDIIVA